MNHGSFVSLLKQNNRYFEEDERSRERMGKENCCETLEWLRDHEIKLGPITSYFPPFPFAHSHSIY